MCNDTLDTLWNFINKFRESCKILENGLLIVKREDCSYMNNDVMSEVEIDIKTIKAEFNDQSDDGFDDYEDLLPLKIKKEEKPIKKEKKSQKVKTHRGNRTNKIASSILEGNFSWNGDRWW